MDLTPAISCSLGMYTCTATVNQATLFCFYIQEKNGSLFSVHFLDEEQREKNYFLKTRAGSKKSEGKILYFQFTAVDICNFLLCSRSQKKRPLFSHIQQRQLALFTFSRFSGPQPLCLESVSAHWTRAFFSAWQGESKKAIFLLVTREKLLNLSMLHFWQSMYKMTNTKNVFCLSNLFTF